MFELRIPVFTKAYPCRTTGSKEWKVFSRNQPFQKFFGFLNYCQIRTIGRIKHLIKSHTMEHIYNLPHHVLSPRHTKKVSYCHPYRWSHLSHHLCIWVSQCLPYDFNISIDADCACGTDCPALSAIHTIRLCNVFVKGRCHQGFRSPIGKIDCIDGLYIVAHADAVAAEYAFIWVSHNSRRTHIDGILRFCIFITYMSHSHTVGQFLQMAFPALDTGGAIPAMSCK